MIALVAGLVAAAAIVSGCSPKKADTSGGTGAKVAKGGTISFFITEPAAIDPYNAQESEGTQVTQSIFDSLTVIDSKTGKVLPAAAESWTSNTDGSVWTFKLRAGAKFQNGAPVTAKDFVFAWNRIAESSFKNAKDPSQISYHLAPVKGFDAAQTKGTPLEGLKAVDDSTFQVTLSQSFADFPYVAAHPGLAPVLQTLVEGGVDYNGAKVPFADMPVGNGPFKMSEPWKHDQYVKVVANADYYGTKANVDGVDFKIFKDVDTAYREFQAGTLDFTSIADGQIESAKSAYGVSADGYTVEPGKGVLTGPEAAIYYFPLNNTKAPFNNVKLRKAVSWAINRQAIADTVYEGTRKPANSFLPPGIPGYENNQWPDSNYDVAKAKALLAEAGYPGGKGLGSIKINYNVGAGHDKVVELIQSDLKAIGIATTSEVLEFPQHIKKLTAGDYQMARYGWIADYPIADNFTFAMFNSKSADNASKYKNLAMDAAMVKARATTDEAARVAMYAQIQKTIGADMPVIPIVYYAHRHVGSNRLNGFVYDNQGLAHFENAWLTNGGASK